jgi:ATP-dependent 26S proteasome regulatory subunit
MSKLKQKVKEAIAAAFSGILIRSYEHEDATREIAEACKEQGWTLLTWDAEFGTRQPNTSGGLETIVGDTAPWTALQTLRSVKTDDDSRAILVMRNVHPLVSDTTSGRILNPGLLQALQHTIEVGAADGKHVVVLSYDTIAIPIELEKMLYVLDHDLPDPGELWELLRNVEENEDNLPAKDSPEGQLLIDAAAGLTRLEASGAFAMSLARHQRIRPDTLWELKSNMLKKMGLLELVKPKTGFDMLGGLNHLKEFTLRSIQSPHKSKAVRSKGVLVIGLPGTGKSAFAKALGKETGLPVVLMDIGSLMGRYIGQTEERTRRALRTIDAMAPCILFVDELEKAMAGAGGGSNDSGVSDRMFGTFLTWLNDHETEVFTVGTCNDIRRLMAASQGAFSRAERFDGVFFVDLPSREQKDQIWDIWVANYRKHGLTDAQSEDRPDDAEWTGAEISACCRQATLHGLSLVDAAALVVPVAKTASEQIDALKEWAHHRCLSADYRGTFDKNGPRKMLRPDEIQTAAARPRRKVTRGG